MKKIVFLGLGLLALAACKPTEKNYQEAYDRAIQKREQTLLSEGGGMLDAMDGTHKEPIGQDTIYVVSGTFKTHEAAPDTMPGKGKIGIAVAKYGMDTNARHHAADLRVKYPGTFVATDGKKHYYVVVDRRPNLPESVGAIRDFQKANPDFRYIAIPEPCAILLID